MIDRIHHVGFVVNDADAAAAFFRDVVGLKPIVDRVVDDVREVLLGLGENAVELLEPARSDSKLSGFLESHEPIHHIAFNTDDINAELARLKSAGIRLIDETPRESAAGQVAFVHPDVMHGVLVALVQESADLPRSQEKGIDHLAAIASDYEGAAQAWKNVVGLDIVNEIEAADRVIAQLPCSQTTFELLAATSEDSPIAERVNSVGPGAVTMIAIEATDIDAEIARYRNQGIELPDPTPGLLPNSVISTISPEQAHGIRLQLIQFGRSE